ncbi:T3SS effector HopA1 family protein [Hymenobacter radiodurans]|uniref:T3SS effector HopA1 family protein n=1 Tax=Hymenobacter radiodurans TaxID=2496028 RepID=UPI00105878EF|nr:T3SS effector HopA1 family protein [Hymenobacter radiodurans]
MATSYQHQLDTILGSVLIDSAQRQIKIARAPAPVDFAPDTLRPTLAGVLYQHFYHADDAPGALPAAAPDLSFEERLRRHNHSTERFDLPWIVEEVDQAGVAYATKGNQKRMLYPGEYVFNTPKRGPVQPGDVLRLLARAEHRDAKSGFYFVFGQTPGDDSIALQTRIYFHLTADGAAPLTAWITQTLNAYRVPFQFKCLNRSDLYGRNDSAVLYLQKPLVSFVLQLLADDVSHFAPHLRSSVPLFTRCLMPGIAFAESPPNPNESFGTSRCGLLAQGIANAVEAQLPSSHYAERVQAVFEQVGLSLEHPYLNPRSHYPYHFPAAFA